MTTHPLRFALMYRSADPPVAHPISDDLIEAMREASIKVTAAPCGPLAVDILELDYLASYPIYRQCMTLWEELDV